MENTATMMAGVTHETEQHHQANMQARSRRPAPSHNPELHHAAHDKHAEDEQKYEIEVDKPENRAGSRGRPPPGWVKTR